MAASTLLGSNAEACSVPVFRFALDRWPTHAWVVAVPRDVLKEAWLHQTIAHEEVDLVAIPLPESAAGDEARLLGPDSTVPVWTGPLDETTLAAIVDSPARRDLVGRILDGHSAVWVYVGGDEPADDAHVERLTRQLRVFEQEGRLPEIDPRDPGSRLGPGPELALRLSVVRVDRDDPAERILVRMLAGPSYAEFADGSPFVAPVFGRGRVLGALPVADVTDDTIDEACHYLTGACSCQVKEQNPGWDLLLAADWDAELAEAEDARTAAASVSDTAATVASPAGPAVERVVFRPRAAAAVVSVDSAAGPLLASLVVLVVVGVGLVVGKGVRR